MQHTVAHASMEDFGKKVTSLTIRKQAAEYKDGFIMFTSRACLYALLLL